MATRSTRVEPPPPSTTVAAEPWIPADIGGGLSLQANSLRLIACSTPLRRCDFRRFNDDLIAGFDFPPSKDGLPSLDVLRSSLTRITSQALNAEGVRTKTGKRLMRIEQPTDGSLGVTAFFEDGSTARGDILVGADGVHSATRAAIFPGTQATKSDFVGYLGVSELTEDVEWNVDSLMFHLDNNSGRSTWVARSSPSRALWCLFETKPGEFSHDSWEPVADLEGTKIQMVDMAKKWKLPEWLFRLIMKSIRITPVTFCYIDPLPTWHKGNVVLIGDACHAMLPFAGQGAAMGIEDAEALATILSKLQDKPREAFTLYEEVRRPRISLARKAAADNTKTMHSTSAVTAAVGRFALRLFAWVKNKLGVDLLPGASAFSDYDVHQATIDFLKAKGNSV
ncbi:hypothetical protein HK405_004384 [Cladochytrium tenue]|nr:hypothetical protein HK405_004384 [Cladochytrium tenue]